MISRRNFLRGSAAVAAAGVAGVAPAAAADLMTLASPWWQRGVSVTATNTGLASATRYYVFARKTAGGWALDCIPERQLWSVLHAEEKPEPTDPPEA